MARHPEYDQLNSKFQRSRVSIMPISRWVKPDWCTKEYWQSLEVDRYALMINWQRATVKEIIKDFAKWLSKEAKNHPELKPRGKRGQVSPEPLTWLAALRISKAGFSYEQARPLLAPTNDLSPNYRDKTGWSRAIKKAEKLLQDLEAGKRIVVL